MVKIVQNSPTTRWLDFQAIAEKYFPNAVAVNQDHLGEFHIVSRKETSSEKEFDHNVLDDPAILDEMEEMDELRYRNDIHAKVYDPKEGGPYRLFLEGWSDITILVFKSEVWEHAREFAEKYEDRTGKEVTLERIFGNPD